MVPVAERRVMVLPRAKIGGRRKPKLQAVATKRTFTPDRRRFFASPIDDPLNLRHLQPVAKPDWTKRVVKVTIRPRVELHRDSFARASWKAIEQLNKRPVSRLRTRVVLTGWELQDHIIQEREKDDLRRDKDRAKWHRLYTGHSQSAPVLPRTAPP